MTQKKLYKSKRAKILTGVLGGIGEYLGLDATVIRVIFIALTVFTGFFPGLVFYIVCALVIPEK